MTFLSKANNAYSKIATVGGIDNSTDPVTFSVITGEGARFPASNFLITIDNEILLCTSRTGDALTCTRAQESTTIAAHAQNADVEHRITKGTLAEYENLFISSKVLSFTRDLAAASGDVGYTGFGFAPKAIILICNIDAQLYGFSIGLGDASAGEKGVSTEWDTKYYGGANTIVNCDIDGTAKQTAVLKTMDSDGFTLTWTKGGSPTGTIKMIVLAIR